jgi:hypothetical protein
MVCAGRPAGARRSQSAASLPASGVALFFCFEVSLVVQKVFLEVDTINQLFDDTLLKKKDDEKSMLNGIMIS